MEGRNAEDLLQASLLGDAVDAAPIAVYVGDDDFRYLAVNRAACDLLGYTREELMRLRVHDILTSPRERLEEEFERFQRTRAARGDTELRRKDGTTVPVRHVTMETRLGGMPVFVSFVSPREA